MVMYSEQPTSSPARLISFIVPAFNEETELPFTLRCIREAAENARCNYEIVLVDDGSTDGTALIGRKFGAQVVSINRRQIAAARNAGAKNAQGDIFVFVDADTRISPQHVVGVIRALAAGFAGGGARLGIEREIPFWGGILFRVFTVIYFALNLGAGAFLF